MNEDCMTFMGTNPRFVSVGFTIWYELASAYEPNKSENMFTQKSPLSYIWSCKKMIYSFYIRLLHNLFLLDQWFSTPFILSAAEIQEGGRGGNSVSTFFKVRLIFNFTQMIQIIFFSPGAIHLPVQCLAWGLPEWQNWDTSFQVQREDGYAA